MAAIFREGTPGDFACTHCFIDGPSEHARQFAQEISSGTTSQICVENAIQLSDSGSTTADLLEAPKDPGKQASPILVPMHVGEQQRQFIRFSERNTDVLFNADSFRLLTATSALLASALDANKLGVRNNNTADEQGQAHVAGPHQFDFTNSSISTSAPLGLPSPRFAAREVTAEGSLLEELQQLAGIVQVMGNLVTITDATGRVNWVNRAFEEQTGWLLDEIKGKDLAALVRSQGNNPALVAQVTDAIAQHEIFRGEIVNQDRHGNRYWVDLHTWPLFEVDGDLRGYVSVETVISRLKEQETAMKELASKAAAAQTRLENAMMALPDGVVVLDAEERIVAVNGAYLETFPELSELAVPGVNLTDLLRAGLSRGVFARDSSQGALEIELQKRMAQYRQQKYVDEVELPSGKWLRRISMRTSDGGCVAVGIDITTSRRHLAALDAVNNDLLAALKDRDAARQRLIRIMDGAGIGTWEWDVIADTLKVGGRWGEIIGFETRTMAIFSLVEFASFLHPDDRKRMEERRKEDFAKGNEAIEHEFRMRHREGHWVWILSRGHVTDRTADGSASAMAGVHIDISERKRLEDELVASQTYLSHIMETNVAAIAVMSREGALTFANAEAQRVLALERDQISSSEYSVPTWRLEGLDGEPLTEAEQPVTRAIAAGMPVREIKLAMRLPDGTRRILACNAAPLTRGDGQVEVVATFSDITEQTATTARLQEALARAEEMSRAKSTFLANMSHEIRTPLNGVLGMAEVLETLLSEPSQKRMIATIRKSGDTLLTVLNGILDMSKIEAGKMVLEEVQFAPVEIARQLEAIYSIQAEEKGLQFEVLSSVGCEKLRLGDSHRIQQILNNLLNNAIKFTEVGCVKMKFSCRPGKPLIVDISDTGIGMNAQQVSRVFESFEQGDDSTTRRFGGTGLGLSIVRQLVKLMEGEISVRTEPAFGTKIRVTLPLAECNLPQAVPILEAIPASRPNTFAGVRMLIADDNKVNLLVLREMLARSGAIITEVENGQQAVDAWAASIDRGEEFAVLLLDITMPVRGGMSALAEIRAAEVANGLSHVPALAVTANAMAGQVTDYIGGGFTAHLAKPFKQSELFDTIHSVLKK